MNLTKSQIAAKTDAFKSVTVSHSLQVDTTESVLFLLELSPNTDIVNLVGPTGVGKSVLQLKVIDDFHAAAKDRMEADPTHIPIIRTHALAAGHKLFSWKSLYRGALDELSDPFVMGRKLQSPVRRERADLPEPLHDPMLATGDSDAKEAASAPTHRNPQPRRQKSVVSSSESASAADLRMCLEQHLRERGTKVWIIDEAQHMVFGGKSGCAGDQFDVIKSIAQNCGIKLLLAGPQEMEGGLGSSAQLARRSVTIHYRRYLPSDAADLDQFNSVVNALLLQMDVAGYPSVLNNVELFYSGCAGCVGILKDWLARAYGMALRRVDDQPRAYLTLDDLRATRLSAEAMRTIMADIRSEEEKMFNPATDEEYKEIVTGVVPAAESDTPPANKAPDKKGGKSGAGKGSIHARKPFERALGRDPVTPVGSEVES